MPLVSDDRRGASSPPDTLEILIHAKKKGLITSLFTNGTLVTPEFADRLAEWQPHSWK